MGIYITPSTHHKFLDIYITPSTHPNNFWEAMSQQQLVKIFFGYLYYIIYFVVTYLAVKIICVDKKYTRLIIYIYALLLLLSVISMSYNYIFNSNLDGNEYTFSRWLMGIAQSPLVAFFMIAANKLYEKRQIQP